MQLNRTELVQSLYQKGQYRPQGLMEVAVVGRSNAGKSSLINCLCGRNKLARVSSTPGKTRSINLYSIDNQIILADLPGYGFAKRGGAEQNAWADLVNDYLERSQTLSELWLLCDIRHAPSEGDRQLADYLAYHQIPFLIIATKADKIAKSKRPPLAKALAQALGVEECICFSTLDGTGKEALAKRLASLGQGEPKLSQT